MNDIDLDYYQRGIGFAATWRFGDYYVDVMGSDGASGSGSQFVTGPSLQLLFPRYAAHRAALDYRWISANFVFIPDSSPGANNGFTSYQIGGGGTF
jgi:hypothetical protein